MAKVGGTNVKPGAMTPQKPPAAVDPAHPGQTLPPALPSGPWYKQKGASGRGKKK